MATNSIFGGTVIYCDNNEIYNHVVDFLVEQRYTWANKIQDIDPPSLKNSVFKIWFSHVEILEKEKQILVYMTQRGKHFKEDGTIDGESWIQSYKRKLKLKRINDNIL